MGVKYGTSYFSTGFSVLRVHRDSAARDCGENDQDRAAGHGHAGRAIGEVPEGGG